VLHSVLAQPKRQALLAYLAIAVPRGYHRRDTIVGLLWPDRDDERARASLSKAVSQLRQTIGADTLLSRGHAELGLDWHRIWCDAAGFEDALDRGALAEAMALYQGDLLPGFYIEETSDFEQWLERERARLRGRAVQASRLLSEREEVAGHFDEAIRWARRAATLEPFDEAIVRRIMTLLDTSADRAGALRTYEEFSTRLRSEFEAEPAAETVALMDAIRERATIAPPPRLAALTSEIALPAASSPAPSIAPAAAPHAARLSRSRVVALTIGIAAAVLVAVWLIRGPRLSASGEVAPTIPTAPVAVLPFVVDGSPTVAHLGDDMVSLLADRFDRDGSMRALDPQSILKVGRAFTPDAAGAEGARSVVARFRPRFVLLGRVAARGDSVRINAALFDSATSLGPIARAEAAGRSDDLAQLTDEIVWQILATQPTGAAPQHPLSTAELTPSLVALRAFLAGDRELAAGRFADAAKAYKTAVDADTTFALAYLNLSRAANWADDYTMSDFAMQRAMRYIDRLAPVDRLRVRAAAAYARGDPIEAERLTRLGLINDVGQADAWYELGELRFHWGPVLGWTIPEAREAYEQSLAISVTDVGTMVHLARIAAAEGRVSAVDSLTRRAIAAGVDGPQALELRGLRANVMGDAVEAERVNAAIARLDDNTAYSVAAMIAVYAAEQPSARATAATLTRAGRAPFMRAIGTIIDAELTVAHGHTADAMSTLASSTTLTPARSIEYRAAIACLPFRATPPAEALSLRGELLALHDEGMIGPYSDQLAVNSIYPPRRAYLLAMLSIKAGDVTGAAHYADQLGHGNVTQTDHEYELATAKLIRAELLHRRGESAQALAMLGPPSELPGRVLPSALNYPSAHDRYLRAELLQELGRPADAMRWYQTFPDPGGYDLMYLAPVDVGIGEAYERMGNRDAARASYRRAIALLADGDAEWSALAARARLRLEKLP
jgi:serine/threonine-protein kinase